MGDQFAGICCGRLKLAARSLMMIWRWRRSGGRRRSWLARCRRLCIVALIALARRYGLHNQHWNEWEEEEQMEIGC